MNCSIKDLKKFISKEVCLKGWAYSLRGSKKIKFLMLRDGSGMAQCIFLEPECSQEVFEKFNKLNQECSVEVKGIVKEGEKNKEQLEIIVKDLVIISDSNNYPITPKEHGPDFLMTHRHLWIRSKKQHAILKIRHEIIDAVRSFFNSNGFILTDSPIFTPNSCEGTSDLFKTQYFDNTVFLSQTGQLYLEALAASFRKVYCFGPAFRAEKSKTRKHLIEFWMVEPEIAFADMFEAMELSETLMIFIIKRVLDNRLEELKVLNRNISNLENIKTPFEKIQYKEACKIIKKSNPQFEEGSDLGAQDEVILSEHFKKPVFVHHFPKKIKAFYMKEEPSDKNYTLSFDLIAPESYGEIVGGGQREDDFTTLERKIKEEGLNLDHYKWYLDLRKYGSFPHSGFGLGIERTVSWICGLQHVRETIPFPRLYGRYQP